MWNLRRAGLDHLARLVEAPSHRALPELLARAHRIDAAFIDGSHRFDDTLLEFYFIDRMLAEGGHVTIDDIGLPAVRKVVTYVLRNKRYRIVPRYSMTSPHRFRSLRRIMRAIGRAPGEIRAAWMPFGHFRCCTLQKVADDGGGDWRSFRSF